MLSHELIISDTSCFVNLERIDAVCLLEQVFKKVIITKEVAMEFGKPVPDWVEVRSASVHVTRELQNCGLDLGEASSIALVLELHGDYLLLLDDLDARIVAAQKEIKFTGLLGVLLRAKKQGTIEKIEPYIKRLKNIGFRMSQKLIQEILYDAGEMENGIPLND
jgi:predicted nucleic acid-binding protein